MSLLTTSIESTRLTGWNFGLVALTLLCWTAPAWSQDPAAGELWQMLDSLPQNLAATDIWIQPETFTSRTQPTIAFAKSRRVILRATSPQ